MNKNRYIQLIVIVAALALGWVFHYHLSSIWAWFSSMDAITVSMHQAGIWGPATLSILFILQVFLAFIPGQALMVACGYLYGFWGGFLLSWLSLVAGGEAAFALARRYGRSFAGKWITADILARWDQTAQGQGIGFFAITLLMPLVPNDAMCYVAGLGRISRPRFFIANLIGRGLACLFTSAAGAFGAALSWLGWAVLIVTFVLIGLTWYLARNRISKLLLA